MNFLIIFIDIELLTNSRLACNQGSFTEELTRYFVGGGIEVGDLKLLSSSDRLQLRTVASGTVHLEIGLIFRDFRKFGIEY